MKIPAASPASALAFISGMGALLRRRRRLLLRLLLLLLLQTLHVLLEENVVRLDAQSLLERGDGSGAIPHEIRDVRAVLIHERVARGDPLRLVELLHRLRVGAAPRGLARLIGERERLLLGGVLRLEDLV